MDQANVSILLDIKEQIGALGAQMHEAARTRERLEDGVRGLYKKIDFLEAAQATASKETAGIKDDVAKLKLLTGKFTAIWGAGFAVLAWALSYFSTEIHTWIFGRHP